MSQPGDASDMTLAVTPAAGPWLYEELALAEALGVSPKLLTKARVKSLAQGVDWDLKAMRVAYSKKGAAAVVATVTDGMIPEDAVLELLQKIAP